MYESYFRLTQRPFIPAPSAETYLPLGSTEFYKPAAMANLLGDLWSGGEPNWAGAISDPNVKLYLYGKSEPKPGRKMGHITAVARSVESARESVISSRTRLTA